MIGTVSKQVKRDNIQQVSRIYLYYQLDGSVHLYISFPLPKPLPQPPYTISAEHSLLTSLNLKPSTFQVIYFSDTDVLASFYSDEYHVRMLFETREIPGIFTFERLSIISKDKSNINLSS